DTLIEAELFGYRDGAFTGARAKGSRGKIVQAHGGTLFLDEIGDMPLPLQTRLLRVLAEHEVTPLGAERPIPVDMQVICATHRNLKELVAREAFRLDLYYRLNGLTLELPPLRERIDKEALLDAILRDEARRIGRASPPITHSARALLLEHDWPGNIRQLKNALRAALALAGDEPIGIEHLPADIAGTIRAALPPSRLTSLGFNEAPEAARGTEAERDALLRALRAHRWNVARAARSLDICRATVYRRMERHNIVTPNRRD
ncbi:MAG: sigma-54-dependent Fis family transcriptional regulator, partial [Proteobacteria bacterium]|nr:sigma-54-dependent Fis family transcriptional regulator [Pseudomonadota bacterium]